jgi:SAM-dependent methyltransferase
MMITHDVYRFINEQDAATTQLLIDRLELRAKNPTLTRLRDDYLDTLQLAPDAQVLDLGCGTGVIGRALAKRDGFSGRVVGVDHSQSLVDAARCLAAQEGLAERLEFHVGDAGALDYADGRFDAVIAHTLLSHAPNPLAVLKEAARVLNPCGRIAIFDGDFASRTYGCSDSELEQRIEDALLATMVNNPRIMRDLPRLLREAGLEIVDVTAHVHAEVGAGSYFLDSVEAYAPLLARNGMLSAEAVECWLAEQRLALAQGAFFAACNYYAYIVRRVKAR